jgi:hypothetical protein
MKHLSTLSEVLLQWARSDSRVEAILWYGSVARGDAGPTSDLDTAVLHAEGCTAREVFGSLLVHLGARVSFSSFAPERSKGTAWVDHQLTKVDLCFGSKPEEFAWLADSADVPVPRLVVGYDPRARCSEIVDRARTEMDRSVADLLSTEIEKWLYEFEAASSAHRRSDGYQFYFHYNLALHHLARIIELLRGEPKYLFLPKMLLPHRMPLPEQKDWRDLRGAIYLPEANSLKRRLAKHFLEAMDAAHSKHRIVRRRAEAEAFVQAVIQRDLFFNVRDVADSFGGRIAPRVLFRASTLTRWRDEPSLAEWIAENRVSTIIDLRKSDEIETATGRYPPSLLASIDYVQLPMPGPPIPSDLPPASPETGHAYVELYNSQGLIIVEAIRALANNGSGATVIHCHAGKDRTGILCACIGLLLGMSEDLVEHDYLLSGQGVVSAAIRHFVQAVGGAEGVRTTLMNAGLAESEILRLRTRLLA